MEVTWSECLDLYNKLQTNITGTTEEIEKIVFLDFKDFVESFKSCKTIKDDEEIAVKTVLERKRHLKRCSIDPSRMSDASDHWKILRKVFENVTVEELYVEGTKLNPSCMSHLATLCNVCKVKGLKLECCDQANDILDISGNKLTPDCMVHLASIWKFCQVKSLKLGMCGIGPKHMTKFATNARNIVIEELDIGCNKLTPNCMIDLARICEDCQVKSLKLGYSSLEPEHLQLFAENVVIAKINELDVSRNKLSSDCMIHLAKITEQCQVKSLKLGSCELGLEHLKKLAENAKNAKIYELDVFENKFTVECMVHLTKICEKFQVKSLKLGWLGLESEHLAKFAEDTKDVKIEKLDVSRNKLPPDCMKELARICEVCQVKSLKLGCCDLESVHLKRFAQDAKVDELDISMNIDVFKTNLFSRLFAWLKGSKDAVFYLAKLCEICEVKKLRMRLCGLTSDHLIKFIEFAKSTKILELDIEGNLDISKESKAELQKFLEFNIAKAEAEVDSTAKVVEIQVINSSQEKYESHLNDTRTYSIDKQRMKGKVLIINNEFSGSSAKHRK